MRETVYLYVMDPFSDRADLGGGKGTSGVAVWGSAIAVVLITAIAVIPRREHLDIGTKPKPDASVPSGGKPDTGGYAAYNRFLVATRLWEFVKIGASNLNRRRL